MWARPSAALLERGSVLGQHGQAFLHCESVSTPTPAQCHPSSHALSGSRVLCCGSVLHAAEGGTECRDRTSGAFPGEQYSGAAKTGLGQPIVVMVVS